MLGTIWSRNWRVMLLRKVYFVQHIKMIYFSRITQNYKLCMMELCNTVLVTD